MFHIPSLPVAGAEIVTVKKPREPVDFVRNFMAVMGTGSEEPVIQTWPVYEYSEYIPCPYQQQIHDKLGICIKYAFDEEEEVVKPKSKSNKKKKLNDKKNNKNVFVEGVGNIDIVRNGRILTGADLHNERMSKVKIENDDDFDKMLAQVSQDIQSGSKRQ